MQDEKKFTHIHAFFEKNPNSIYKLVTILDVNIKDDAYYFMAVFKDINKKNFDHILIPPELLRNKYKIGYHYKNGNKFSIPNEISRKKIEIEINNEKENHSKLIQNSSLFGKEFIFDDLNKYYKDFFLKQWSFKINMQDYILIIPSYSVLLRYYLLSTSMKNAVMKNNLKSLYHEIYPITSDTANIHIKRNANKKDLPFLCRFLYNPDILEKIKELHLQSIKAINKFIQIKSYFPVYGKSNILVNCKLLDIQIDEKPVIYVLNIINDDSELGFSKLIYKQYSSKDNSAKHQYEEIPVPKKRIIRRKKSNNQDNIIRMGTPSNENSIEFLYEKVEKDFNTLNLEVINETIYIPSSNTRVEYDFTNNKGSNSFETATSSGDGNLSQVSYSEKDKENTIAQIFSLKDFLDFYEILLQELGVEEIESPDLFHIEQIKNSKQSSINSKCINILTKSERRFMFAILEYNSKVIYIIEFERDTSWKPSTWLFISKAIDEENDYYDIETFKSIIHEYISNQLTYDKLKDYCNSEYQLKMITHNHKNNTIDDDSIEDWCENLLNKTNLLQN